jgi:hypothetical protein
MNAKLVCLLMVFFTFTAFAQNPVAFYVSPFGNDDNPGTKEKPFLSFDKAKETVVKTIDAGLKGQDIAVYFCEGSYFFDNTSVMKGSEFSKGNNRIVFSAYPGEKPIFSAGMELAKWSLLKDDLLFLPDVAKGKVWVTDLPETGQEGIARFLCDESGPLRNSVSGPFLTAEDDSITSYNDYNSDKYPPERRSFFVFPESSMRRWENLQDIEVAVIPYRSWVYEIIPLKSVDVTNRIAYTAFPAMHKITKMWHYSKFKEPNLWVINAIDYLDEPGEWVIDSSAGKIYYWPESGNPGRVFYPVLTELIRIEGDMKGGNPAKNIVFRGITFSHADRFNRKEDSGNYDTKNKPDALLRFINSENCVIDHCTFTNSGGGGVRFDSYSKSNQVINSRFSMLGGTGILVSGERSKQENNESNNEIINNEVFDIGKIYKTSAGIAINSSNGNRIAHNLVYNTPYNGILGNGGLVVEYNEIHHACMEIHDGNAIYLNGLDILIRRNYLHDNISPKNHGIIRSDDWGKDMVISENIIYRYTDCGIKFKQPTTVTNNYIIDWIPSEWVNGERYSMSQFIQVSPSEPIKGSVIKNNIFYQSAGATQPLASSSR